MLRGLSTRGGLVVEGEDGDMLYIFVRDEMFGGRRKVKKVRSPTKREEEPPLVHKIKIRNYF